jgi:Uma2 family endonuclease
MATASVRSGPFTYEDFCALVGDHQKGDLIDGVIYVASPDNTDANDLSGWLYTLARLYARRKKLGRVYGSRVACRLDDRNAPEPDILFVTNVNLPRIKRGGIAGAADLAIEIVSPESVERDYVKKKQQYERFGFREYWIVDEEERKVTLWRLDAKGKYREVKPRKGIFHSEVMTGFWLDPRWLWQRPLPDELDTLQQIMAEQE